MTQPYSGPKRLTRSRTDRMISGVCGGIADYLNMDSTLVRVLVVVIALVAFPTVIIYLILMMVIPEASPVPPPSVGPSQPQGYQPWHPYQTQQHTDRVWGSQSAPWEQQPATSATPPPRQSPEDLFSRAKSPEQSAGAGQNDGSGPASTPGTNAAGHQDADTDPAGDSTR